MDSSLVLRATAKVVVRHQDNGLFNITVKHASTGCSTLDDIFLIIYLEPRNVSRTLFFYMKNNPMYFSSYS